MASGESCGEEPPAGNGRSATTHVQVVDGEPYLSAIPLCRVCDSDSCYGVSLCQDKSRKGVVAFILYRFTKFKIIEKCATIVQSLCRVFSQTSQHGVPRRSGVAAATKFCGGSECDNKRARSARGRTGRRPRGGGDGSALSTNELRASALRASSLPLGCFCRACN